MQFHLNGFRPGDAHISEADVRHQADGTTDGLPTQVDVLIVGCGPTGLTLAAQLAAFPDITTRIVEQKSSRLLVGQADGIACRTMEMFEAFGFAGRVMKEAYWVNEFAFWRPDETRSGALVRSNRIQDVEDGLSEFPHVVLNQARVHDFYLDAMHNSPTRLAPDYNRRLLDLALLRRPDAPVPSVSNVSSRASGRGGNGQRPLCRGCDGRAHRAPVPGRRCMAIRQPGMGEWTFSPLPAPDVRLKAAVSRLTKATLIIPRGGYMFRIYHPERLTNRRRAASLNITPCALAAASRIFHPYSLEVKEIIWWSVYEIGQRLCDRSTTYRRFGRRRPPASSSLVMPATPIAPKPTGNERLHAGWFQPRLETCAVLRGSPRRNSSAPIPMNDAPSLRS
jgi:hypothetical protein